MDLFFSFLFFFFLSTLIFGVVIYFIDKFVISMKFSDINIISYNIYVQVGVFCLIGSSLFISGAISDDIFFKMTSLQSRIHAYISLFSSLVFFALFLWIYSNISSKMQLPRVNEYKLNSNSTTIFLTTIVIIDILLLVYIYFGLEQIPLIELISGNYKEAAILRIQNTQSFKGINLIYNVFAKYYIPSVSLILFFINKKSGNSYKWMFRLSLIIAVLFLLHDTQKAPILNFIITIILINIYSDGFKMKYVKYLLYIVGVSIIIYGFAKGIGFDQLEYLLYRVGRRIFVSQVAGLFLSFEFFPAYETFMYTLQGAPTLLLQTVGLDDINSARDIMLKIEGNSQGLGVMNSYYMSGAWASYGYLGYILGPLIVSLNYFLMHKLFFFYKRYLFVGIPLYFSFVVKLVFTADFKLFAFFTCLIIPFLFYYSFIFLHIISNFIVSSFKSK